MPPSRPAPIRTEDIALKHLITVFMLLTGATLCQADEPRNPALLGLPANSWVYLNPKPYTRQMALKRDEGSPLTRVCQT